MARRAVRPETPARLRLWVAVAVLTAATLLAGLSLLMARVQDQIRIIGDEAALQAATAADLYFALSDMDAQVARLVLTAGDDQLAGSQIDALGAYQARSRQVDTDLQKSPAGAADKATVLTLLDQLAVYRERVWQTLTAGDAAPGYYTQATNTMHLGLLPAAQSLRSASEERLSQAYAGKRATEVWAVTSAIALGGALLALLLALQVWLARGFRRVLNLALLAATALTIALVLPAIAVLLLQGDRLGAARSDSLTPFLRLSQARAISYDAAADTSRYLIGSNLAFYDDDFKRKSACLTGDGCDMSLPAVAGGSDVSPYQTDQVITRWQAYVRDHQKIVTLAAAGEDDDAIGALTGIRRLVGPIALAYNVAGVSTLRLRPDTIARIFDGRLAAWNDPAITRDNPGAALPATPIRTVHRSDSSGTTDNFTKFLAGTAGQDWTYGSGSAWKASSGLAVKGSNQVVSTIERSDGAIGYVEASYARFHNLPIAAVGISAGNFAALTDEAAGRMIGSARIVGAGGDLPLAIDYRSVPAEAYPIVLVTYEIVCKTGTPALVKSS